MASSAAAYPVNAFPPEAQALARAVVDGKTNRVLDLAKTTPGGINATGAKGETALLLAVQKGDTAMVRALLAAGASPNGGPDKSPLHPATRQTNGEMLRLLLAAKANPNATYNGESPLFEAALIGAIPAAKQLLDAGANPNFGQIDDGDSPALAASSADKWEMVVFLIDHGASPWYSPATGATIASDAYHSRKQSEAREQVIARFQSFGYPWPPPKPPIVRQMMAEGRWPPAMQPPR
jgi:ankyrin repeat protein